MCGPISSHCRSGTRGPCCVSYCARAAAPSIRSMHSHEAVAEAADWLAWPVWTFIATIAQVLSLLAIGFAIIEVLRIRRRVRPVVFQFDIHGYQHNTETGEKFHAAELRNAGSGTAVIVWAAMIGGRLELDDDHRFVGVLGSGQVMKLLVSAEKIAHVWIQITWISHEDSRRYSTTWITATRSGLMADLWLESVERQLSIPWYARLLRRTMPVGPGAYLRSSFRTKPGDSSRDKKYATLMQAIGPGLTYPMSAVGDPGDLPFIPQSR